MEEKIAVGKDYLTSFMLRVNGACYTCSVSGGFGQGTCRSEPLLIFEALLSARFVTGFRIGLLHSIVGQQVGTLAKNGPRRLIPVAGGILGNRERSSSLGGGSRFPSI